MFTPENLKILMTIEPVIWVATFAIAHVYLQITESAARDAKR
jgi:hypothetical protein